MSIPPSLAHLPKEHRDGLLWFESRQSSEIIWPAPVDGLFLMNKAKGIHKPKGWAHVLSIRQSLGGPYADKEIKTEINGSWTYQYHQEGDDPTKRDDDFTNRALMRNMVDGVPVAVVIQSKGKPAPRYKVLGLARVTAWQDGFFTLQSILVDLEGLKEGMEFEPMPLGITDARRRTERAIVARRGTGKFRARALELFNKQCAVTGYNVEQGLEAAHIVPYLGEHTNIETNSLLLRADLHTLFDCGLLSIDPVSFKVRLAQHLIDSSIGEIEGRTIYVPHSYSAWRRSFQQRQEVIYEAVAKDLDVAI